MKRECDRNCFECPYDDCIRSTMSDSTPQSKYYREHREERLAYQKRYVEEHKEQIRIKEHERYVKRREAQGKNARVPITDMQKYQREYYLAHREQYRERYRAKKERMNANGNNMA